jgi:hypothetical protein
MKYLMTLKNEDNPVERLKEYLEAKAN